MSWQVSDTALLGMVSATSCDHSGIIEKSKKGQHLSGAGPRSARRPGA
jgi:hypothetical protein